MRKALLAGVLVAGLAGCSVASGSFVEPGQATQAVALPALDDLMQRPVLNYQGTVDNLAGTGASADIAIDVTQTGTFIGRAEIGGVAADLVGVQEAFLVQAPEKFWTAYGVTSGYAGKIDGKWAQIDPDVSINPAVELTPVVYAEALNAAMEQAQTLEVALPEAIDRDGVSVYPLVVGEGAVYMSTEEPHTVVAVQDVAIELPSGPVTLSVEVAGVDRTYAEFVQEGLVAAVEGMSTVYDNGVSLLLTETNQDFKCDSSDFSCKVSTKVTPQFSSGYNLADRVKITLKATIDGGSLGKKKCDKDKTGDVDDTVSMSCTVKFTPTTGEFTIEPDWTVSGVASFKPDTDEWAQAVTDEFAGVLAEY